MIKMKISGNCPFLTAEGYLHWDSCNKTGCPNSSFVSNEVYKCMYTMFPFYCLKLKLCDVYMILSISFSNILFTDINWRFNTYGDIDDVT